MAENINYELMPGFRQTSLLLHNIEEQQIYKKANNYNNGTRYICYHKNCNVSLFVDANGHCQRLQQNALHAHGNQEETIKQMILENKIKEKCQDVALKESAVRDIFNEECMSNKDSAHLVQFKKMYRNLRRIKHQNLLRKVRKAKVNSVKKQPVLVGTNANNVTTKHEKEESWWEVLHKAQSMESPAVEEQTSSTLEHQNGFRKILLSKPNNAQTTADGSNNSTILNETENESTLSSKDRDSPIMEFPGLFSEEDMSVNNTKLNQLQKPQPQTEQSKNCIENIKQQVFETELYFNKLKILKMERELGLPPSKYTKEFCQQEQAAINIASTCGNNNTGNLDPLLNSSYL